MKKITALILAFTLLLSLSGCDFLFREGPPEDNATSPPTSSTPTDAVPPSIEPTATPEVVPTVTPDADEPEPSESPEPSAPPANSKELTVYISGNPITAAAIPYSGQLRDNVIGFEIFYNNTDYSFEFTNNAYVLKPVAEDANQLDYMEISYINGGKAETILPSFADSYIDFSDIEFASYTPVGEKHINAESIIAYNTEQYINAYLIDTSAGVVTIVVSSSSQYSESFAWFNAMLATFIIE